MKNSAGTGGGAFGGILNFCTLLTNSAATGGGACSNILNGCGLAGNKATGNGGGVYQGALSNCTLTGNAAATGGGAFGGVLNLCTLSTNTATIGGGAASNTLYGCVLLANTATASGGGAYGSILNACTVALNTNFNDGSGLLACMATGCTISNNLNRGPYGGGAYNSALTNCLILNNSAQQGGGGAYGGTLINCRLSGNVASNTVGGGGACQSTLYNCVISGNRAPAGSGGGGYGCALNGCLISSNSASTGSGIYNGLLNNCTIVGHTNSYAVYNAVLRNCIDYFNANNYAASSFTNCCTSPLPAGTGNSTGRAAFHRPGNGRFSFTVRFPLHQRWQQYLCHPWHRFDGNPRIKGGTVDIGAYEFQNPSSVMSYAWLHQYNLPTDGSADFIDSDGDGMDNWQEWIAGTVPTNALSVLRMLAPSNRPSGITINWQSVGNRTYYLQRSTNLALLPAFSSIQSNIVGQMGTTSFTDTNVGGSGPHFYRVGVQ